MASYPVSTANFFCMLEKKPRYPVSTANFFFACWKKIVPTCLCMLEKNNNKKTLFFQYAKKKMAVETGYEASYEANRTMNSKLQNMHLQPLLITAVHGLLLASYDR